MSRCYLFDGVGTAEQQTTQLLDAQGAPIPQVSQRANVSFVVEGSNGQQIVFKDRAVLAKVRQPLLCVGKLFRGGWYPRPSADGDAAMFMCKGSQEFPIHFSRNSLAASMRILRTEELSIRSVIEVPDSLLSELRRSLWQVTNSNSEANSLHCQAAGEGSLWSSGSSRSAASC